MPIQREGDNVTFTLSGETSHISGDVHKQGSPYPETTLCWSHFPYLADCSLPRLKGLLVTREEGLFYVPRYKATTEQIHPTLQNERFSIHYAMMSYKITEKPK